MGALYASNLNNSSQGYLPHRKAEEGGEQMAFANHSEMFLLELLENYKMKSEENHLSLPTKGRFQSKPTQVQTGEIKLKVR